MRLLLDFEELEEDIHLTNPSTDDALVDEEVVVKREATGDEDSVRSSPVFLSDDADFNDPLGDQQKKKTGKVKRCRPAREHSSAPLAAAGTDKKKRRKATEEDEQRLKNFYHLACEVCAKVSDSFSDLLAHYRTAHNTGGFVRCCDRTFKKKCLALEHLEVHLGTIRCDICSKTYNSVDTLELHNLQQHSGPEAKPFKCDKCHQSFPKAYLLKSHLKRHKQEPCPTCGKMLSNYSALKMHIAMIHKKTPNLICDICGKEMTTKQTMERHMNMHMGLETVERVQCGQCQKWFKGIYVLQRHVKHVHTEQGQIFQCDICLQKYPNTRALTHHKQRVHVEEKFACEFCGKRFKRKIYLREHVASHTGQPLYSCNLCTATFNSSGNLYAHRRKSHVGAGRGNRNSSEDSTLRKSVRNQAESIT
ncbi:transcription factor grauzone-like [Anopheles cruzii]|uniref:transcription factor grauzone-like n=1 Tax=Anopheles cruzii TaxID=68878 RepID=UPI0022EC6600|nr:transcription factor grauzone-like [Anopheles cruzii]